MGSKSPRLHLPNLRLIQGIMVADKGQGGMGTLHLLPLMGEVAPGFPLLYHRVIPTGVTRLEVLRAETIREIRAARCSTGMLIPNIIRLKFRGFLRGNIGSPGKLR